MGQNTLTAWDLEVLFPLEGEVMVVDANDWGDRYRMTPCIGNHCQVYIHYVDANTFRFQHGENPEAAFLVDREWLVWGADAPHQLQRTICYHTVCEALDKKLAAIHEYLE